MTTACVGSAVAIAALAYGTPPPGPVPESTHRYVVSVLDIPGVSRDGHVAGLNLDPETDDPATAAREDVDDGTGRACTDHRDYVSPITGEIGVDNQLSTYLIDLIALASPSRQA